jgi:hypothetical protein
MKITMHAMSLSLLIESDSFLEMREKETDKEFTMHFKGISNKSRNIIISQLNHLCKNKELNDKPFFVSSLECLLFSLQIMKIADLIKIQGLILLMKKIGC